MGAGWQHAVSSIGKKNIVNEIILINNAHIGSNLCLGRLDAIFNRAVCEEADFSMIVAQFAIKDKGKSYFYLSWEPHFAASIPRRCFWAHSWPSFPKFVQKGLSPSPINKHKGGPSWKFLTGSSWKQLEILLFSAGKPTGFNWSQLETQLVQASLSWKSASWSRRPSIPPSKRLAGSRWTLSDFISRLTGYCCSPTAPVTCQATFLYPSNSGFLFCSRWTAYLSCT